MNAVRNFAAQAIKSIWLREGVSRRCFVGPYAGLIFEISPPLRNRTSVFYKAYEPEVTDLLSQRLQPGMTFCNVGAHVGVHTLYAAKSLKSKGRVYAFEAWPENFRCLRKNVQLNNHIKAEINIIHGAVGEEEGIMHVARGHTDGTHHVARKDEATSVEVEAITLDRFFADEGVTPDIMLIDVEGAELNVLRGARRLVEDSTPELVLEHHGGDSCDRLAEWLINKDYNTRTVGQRHLHAW